MNIMQALKEGPLSNLRQSGIYIAFIAIVALFAVLTNGQLLSSQNVSNIVVQNSYILVLAIGMVMVIIAGHIDLSVGSVVALAGAIAGVVIVRWDYPWIVGVLAAIAVGALIGAWQGFWVAFFGIPAFIVTLAGMLAFRGLTMIVLGNAQIGSFPDGFQNISSGFINGLLGGNGYDVFTLLVGALCVFGFAVQQVRARAARRAYHQKLEPVWLLVAKIVLVGLVVMAFAWKLATYSGLPIVLIVLAVLILVYTVITQNTAFGRAIYAIGGNLSAARLSGIKVQWVNFWIFVNMGVLSAIAGIVFTARLNLANPKAGNMFELDAIAACFIGGAAVTGGVGRVAGAIVGGLIMGIINNGMSLMGVGSDWQLLIKGLVLLGAVAFDVYNKRKSGVTA
ncbi:sugar ABC transporter permease [Dermabacteraceae bacterium TAE3-ERU27]|nr:sugar ABC transporter permease [Dermabacteraceae bacterium TAE3-ERU27]